MNILFVIPALDFSGSGSQLTLLATKLPPDRFHCRVCVLGGKGPLEARLRAAGVEVETLGWTRWVDARPFWRLRRLVKRFRPDVIHAWRLSALRAAAAADGRSKALVSDARPTQRRGTRFHAVDRWLIGRADRVVAAFPGQAQVFERQGLDADKIDCIAPGVILDEAHDAPGRQPPVRPSAAISRFVLCVGPLEPRKGYREAVWAFDILKYLYDDLHLVVIGDGPERARLEEFARVIRAADRVHFLGRVSDLTPWLACAEVVWVPSLVARGVNVALEAMAAGRPVVASRLPGLAALVADGVTGFLVEPGDKVGLARQTRLLLENADRRRELGEAARRQVRRRFAAAALVGRYAGLYEKLAG